MCPTSPGAASHDYLVSINRKSVEELSLAGVKDSVKHAKSFLELEVRRYAGEQASEFEREQEESAEATRGSLRQSATMARAVDDDIRQARWGLVPPQADDGSKPACLRH